MDIRVILMEPNKAPAVVTVERSLGFMQKLVGGYIEYVFPNPVGLDVDFWANEEGILLNLPFNRFVYEKPIVGPILVTGREDEDGLTQSLTDEQIQRVLHKYDHLSVS